MTKFYLIAAMILASVQAQAMDHRSQWGVGGDLGATFPAPWASKQFRDLTSPKFPTVSAWARYVPGTPEVGFEFSYLYFGVGKAKINTHAALLTFFSRQNPWGKIHPFYGLGFGFASVTNWYTRGGAWQTGIVRLVAGVEYELNERTDVGFLLNHYTIFKNEATEPHLHVLAPALAITYYFGSPEPQPAPAITAPAAAPAAPAAEATTAPTTPIVAPPAAGTQEGTSATTKKKSEKKPKSRRKDKAGVSAQPPQPNQ